MKQTKNTPKFSGGGGYFSQSLKKKKAFTLVELIIVITILAILATIAFIAFGGFTKDSRDANRLTTFKNIEKGLQLYETKEGLYPVPDGPVIKLYSGATEYSHKGYIGDTLSQLLQFSTIPFDPKYKTQKYIYATTPGRNYYQVATIKEGELLGNILGIPGVYADDFLLSHKPLIDGDFIPGTLVNNLPIISLIFGGDTVTESGVILNQNTLFVTNSTTFLGKKIEDTFEFQNIFNQINTQRGNGNEIEVEDLKNVFLGNQVDLLLLQEIQDIIKNKGNNGFSQGNSNMNKNETFEDRDDSLLLPNFFCIEGNTGINLNSIDIINNLTLTEDKIIQNINPDGECYFTCKNGYSGSKCQNTVIEDISTDIGGVGKISLTINGNSYDYYTKVMDMGNGKKSVWTSQNMRHPSENCNNAFSQNQDNSWCGFYSQSVDKKYGMLYQWSAAMGGKNTEIGCNTTAKKDCKETQKSVCSQLGPDWRLPTDMDWRSLEKGLGCKDRLENTQRACKGLGWKGVEPKKSLGGILTFLSGFRESEGTTKTLNTSGYRWSSTQLHNNASYYMSLTWDNDKSYYYRYDKKRSYSVVCVKDLVK